MLLEGGTGQTPLKSAMKTVIHSIASPDNSTYFTLTNFRVFGNLAKLKNICQYIYMTRY